MTIKPTITYKSTDGDETLAVWPAIKDVTENPVIQIDRPRKLSVTVEYTPEAAHAIAAAIIAAAEASK
ncbi:hypothetical protein SEA_OTTAWA_36 [Arthrobacter phage Ottawa]|nr:hypothetical protein SEA_KHARCHO_36 [Arthrobacter phage Kharcho]WIC89268.1 hypothetical protein SEA_OTTAWA_36 [Arthrobacter phage Ottawa]